MRVFPFGKALRKAALLAHGTQQGDQFDHDQCRSEAAQRIGSVKAARDEQERQARQQAQQEAEEILPSALREGGQVFILRGGTHPASPSSALSGRASMPSTTALGLPPCSSA